MSLQGTYTAIMTPFQKDGEIDWGAFKKLVEFQVDNKIEGLVPCGTTGESPTLSHPEHREVIAKVIEWSKAKNPDIKVIAGAGSNSTREAVSLSKSASDDGADYVLQVNPYYNKPTQAGLYKHFSTIADASEVPLILYNIPGRTGVRIEIDTMSKLSEHPNIAGVKEATGDIAFMGRVRNNTPDDFILLAGDDNILLPLLSIGGSGVISVISNIFPFETGEITRRFFAGDYSGAKDYFFKLLPLCKAMFLETNPVPVKFAASQMQLCENVLRSPMTQLDSKFHDEVLRELKKFREAT